MVITMQGERGGVERVEFWLQSPSMHTPNPKGPMGPMGPRARSEGVSALSRGEEQDAPPCFSGESNDSHVERVTSHVRPGLHSTICISGVRDCCEGEPLNN